MEMIYNKNYTQKILTSKNVNEEYANDINNLIVLINYCFHTKNNFFIAKFNKKVLPVIYLTYNKLKSNILDDTQKDVLFEISMEGKKALKFILTNLYINYDNNNTELCSIISKNSLKRLSSIME